jgi:hypothetical protein
MDGPHGQRTIGGGKNTKSQSSVARTSSAPHPAKTYSVLETILYIIRQIFEVPVTALLLGIGFILPEVKDSIASIGMGKKFAPERDIGSLDGKVILVTGGTRPILP